MLVIRMPPFEPPSAAMRPGRVTPRRTRSAATAAKSSCDQPLAGAAAGLVPGRAELAAAADVGDDAGAAALEPELADRRVVVGQRAKRRSRHSRSGGPARRRSRRPGRSARRECARRRPTPPRGGSPPGPSARKGRAASASARSAPCRGSSSMSDGGVSGSCDAGQQVAVGSPTSRRRATRHRPRRSRGRPASVVARPAVGRRRQHLEHRLRGCRGSTGPAGRRSRRSPAGRAACRARTAA